MKKKVAITLYVLYALFVIFLLIFGSKIAIPIRSFINTLVNTAEIEGVTTDIDLSKPLLSGKNYYVKYTAEGRYRGDAGLEFESLTPDIVKVGDNGAIYGYNDYNGDSISGKIRITSRYDSDFEKILDVTFIKKYPASFTVGYNLKGVGKDPDNIYIGIPIKVYVNIPSGEEYNVTSYEIIYNKEYLSYNSETGELTAIKPTKAGEKLTVTVKYANGTEKSSKEFAILQAPFEVNDIDEIRLTNVKNPNSIEAKSAIFFTLYKGGEQAMTDYTVVLQDGEGGSVNSAGAIVFSTPGEKTITIKLPNGYTRSVKVFVKNIIELPTLVDVELNRDGAIEIWEEELSTLRFTFGSNITYEKVTLEYDEAFADITVSGRQINIEPSKVGETEFKLIIDDGYQRVEQTYKLKIKEDTRAVTWIGDHVGRFVAKYMGHVPIFAVLAFLAMNLFRFVDERNLLKRFAVYTMMGLPVAAITEFVQHFIPGRSGTFGDVMIDMIGYYLGTLLVVAIVLTVKGIKKIIKLIKRKTDKEEAKR